MPLSPEQQDELYANLMGKYKSDEENAQAQAQRANQAALFGNIAEDLVRAKSVGRGGQVADTSFYNNLQKSGQQKVQDVKEQKAAAIKGYLEQKKAQDDASKYANDLEFRNKEFQTKQDNATRDFELRQKELEAKRQDLLKQNQFNQGLEREKLDIRRQEMEAKRVQDQADKEAKNAEKTTKTEAERQELEVPGYGQARSKKEAADLRTAVVDTKSAIDDLAAVKELGKDVNVLTDRARVAKINQLLNSAVGKLRISMTGPGAMTESERQMVRESIGDPTALFSTEAIQQGKLDQLMDDLRTRLNDEIAQKVIPSQTNQPQQSSKPGWAK